MKTKEIKITTHTLKKHHILIGVGIILLAIVGFGIKQAVTPNTVKTETISVKPVSTTILANGDIESKNEATLHFQTGGQLVYLPFKEGDAVTQGQVVAQLDQRIVQQNVQGAAKAAQNQKINFDIVNDANGDRVLTDTGLSTPALRQLQTSVNTLDQAQIAVTIQKIVQEQTTLTSPIDGIITHEDVTTPLVNVTPATSFTIADPTQRVFRANVSETDINLITIGASAKITLAGDPTEYAGIVAKLYPDKKFLPSGEAVYQVDIESDALKDNGKFKQAGAVLIQNKFNQPVILLPSWTVLAGQYVWVLQNNKPVLKKVTIGETIDNTIEILHGIAAGDHVIVDPKSIISKKYILL